MQNFHKKREKNSVYLLYFRQKQPFHPTAAKKEQKWHTPFLLLKTSVSGKNQLSKLCNLEYWNLRMSFALG